MLAAARRVSGGTGGGAVPGGVAQGGEADIGERMSGHCVSLDVLHVTCHCSMLITGQSNTDWSSVTDSISHPVPAAAQWPGPRPLQSRV